MNTLPKGYYFINDQPDDVLAAMALVANLFILGWQLMPALSKAMNGEVKKVVLIGHGKTDEGDVIPVAICLLENDMTIHTFVKEEHRKIGLGSILVKTVTREFPNVNAVEGENGSIDFYRKNNLVAKQLRFCH